MNLFGHGSARTWFCSDRVLLDGILFGESFVRHLSLCSGRVFGLDSVRTKFCSAVVTLLGQSVRTGFYSNRILLGRYHSARAKCSDGILFGQNSARPLSFYSGRVFGRDSARARFCSATVTLYAQSVWTLFCSGRILFGHGHFARAECSDTILLGQDFVRPLPWFPPRVSFSITVFERELRTFKFLYSSACDTCVVDEPLRFPRNENMSETSASVFSSEKSSSSSSSKRVLTSESEVGTSNPQLPLPSTSHPFQPSTSQPLPPSSSQPSHSLSRKNALGDVKDQADDKANPKPWYTADEKSGKMSTEDLQDLFREYPLPEGWYARLPGLQEPANYGTKFETGIYEEQVKSGYRLPLHPFPLRFFEHYRMAPGQLVPNGWRKLAGLIYLVQTSGYKPDATYFMRVFFEICFIKRVANCPGWYYIHTRQRLLKGGPKSNKVWHSRYFIVGRLDKGELPFDRDWNLFCKDFKNPGTPTPNNLTKHILSHIKLRGELSIDEPLSEQQLEWARIIPRTLVPAGAVIPPPAPTISSTFPAESASLECSPRILEQVSIDDDPIFRPRWTLRRDDLGMPDSQVSEQHLLHGILPRDKEVFQTQTHETFAYSFAQAVYTMYTSGSEMLSRFEMARQVAAEEAQQKRDKGQEATHRAEELSNREEDYLAKIATLEKRLEKAAEEVTKARDQGIRDFLDGNAGDEWLKKRTEDGLEIYDLGFVKAKEMFAERFPDIPLDDFVLPAVISSSGETVLPSEASDAAASHPLGEGPSGDAPEP
ncbi:hypothetical protein RJ639_028433 [Escallonia herrerae]|uniref:Transposase (putative) gypsy type domain-containing protein n=1 Tax=Escallonia herrerae TaxID=1293975 RepID=A0AA89BGK5_9ASTE|nr:hypothetical protein RJ639_028433 [Escallonia herrerae]